MRFRSTLQIVLATLLIGIHAQGAWAKSKNKEIVQEQAVEESDVLVGLSAEQVERVGGHERDFFFYRPPNFDPSKGMIVLLHGGGGSGPGFFKGDASTFKALSDRVGVLLIFPDGKPVNGDPGDRTWNGCSVDEAVDDPTYDDWDDVSFLRSLVPWAQQNISPALDVSRVYFVGFSEGGFMAERMLLESSDIIAAGGVFAANVSSPGHRGTPFSDGEDFDARTNCSGYRRPWKGLSGPDHVTPVFLFKGDADGRIPYGNVGVDHREYCQVKDPAGLHPPCTRGAIFSYYDTVAFWQWKLGLSPDRRTVVDPTSTRTYEDTIQGCTTALSACDGSWVERRNYGPEPSKLVVEIAHGGGHAFPNPNIQAQASFDKSGWHNRDKLGQDRPYIAEEIWAFFDQFRLGG